MKKDFLLILDAGHGGIHPRTGKYTTAPAKQFDHGGNNVFHIDSMFCEGVFNRQVADLVAQKCKRIGLPHVRVYHEYEDTTLQERVDRANFFYTKYPQSLFVSIHANASTSHAARGTEVWTSPGETDADIFATNYWSRLELLAENRIEYRRASRGNPSKEANFYVLIRTMMPAILVETLFFDNLEDALLLNDPYYQDIFAESIFQGALLTASQMP